MKFPGLPYTPRYTRDEIVLGVVAAIALHAVGIGPIVLDAIVSPDARAAPEEQPRVARPVVQASLLKLGKPRDPSALPDRLVPQRRTAPKPQITASREEPRKREEDAGAPPPNVEDSDILNLVSKSDPFAEAPHGRPEEGHESGVEHGTETDPSKVRAGDMYAAQLGAFFGQHLSVPSVISVGDERRLCAVYEINVGKNMVIWHVRNAPVRGSGNELFDDAARTMLLKLLDDKTPLPQPPSEVEELYRGRRIQIVVTGRNGDPSRCMR